MVTAANDLIIEHYRHHPQQKKDLATYYQELVGEQFWPYHEVEASLKKSSTSLWYAHDNLKWLGFLLAESFYEQSELYYLYVTPDARGLGIGAKLLNHWLSVLATQNIKSAFLEVRKSNRPAQALYERCGFVFAGKRPNYYRDGEDAFIYERSPSC
ncbi:MAG: ribosomal protein S18-alanine N-acetyltransferase [Oligoflexus sp.]